MKRNFLIALFLLSSLGTLTVNAQSYQKGDKLLNVGIGLQTYWTPIGGTFEYGITDAISVGPSVHVASYSAGDGTLMQFSARGSYHVNELLKISNDKIDVYAGAGLGYTRWSFKGVASGGYSSGIYVPVHIGGRYYFSSKLGVHLEAGAGVSNLLGGLTLKL